jgi:hypothetical protein
MPFYKSTDQLYRCLQTLFARVEEMNPDAGETVHAGRLITRLHITDPAAEITTNARRHPVQTIYGRSSLRPDFQVDMSGDTLHRILLDELSIKRAYASGLIKVHGPYWKILGLADLFHKSQAVYPQVLAELGLPVRRG